MEIYCNCVCGRAFAAPPHLAGSQVACPYCGRFMGVPKQGVREINPVPWIIAGFAVLLVLLLCGGLVAGLAWNMRSAAPNPAGDALEVQSRRGLPLEGAFNYPNSRNDCIEHFHPTRRSTVA